MAYIAVRTFIPGIHGRGRSLLGSTGILEIRTGAADHGELRVQIFVLAQGCPGAHVMLVSSGRPHIINDD